MKQMKKGIIQQSRHACIQNKMVKRFKFTKHWFDLTFLFSLSLAASLGWLKRNMLVLPSNITAPDEKNTHSTHCQHSAAGSAMSFFRHATCKQRLPQSKNKLKMHFHRCITMHSHSYLNWWIQCVPSSSYFNRNETHTCSHIAWIWLTRGQACSWSSVKE